MPKSMLARLFAAVTLMSLVGIGLAFQDGSQSNRGLRPDARQEISDTRDNFHPKASKLPRLSAEELDKAIAADFDKEAKAKEANAKATGDEGEVAVPEHRRSRDVLIKKAAGKKKKEFQITLKNWFIEKYKNRATITTGFQVVAAAKRIHDAASDGDLHVAGLADEIMLPCVAEIMNAKFHMPAVQLIRNLQKSGEIVQLTGCWRLWCEHPDSHPPAGPQIQDDVIADYQDSNPNHVFEIHPVNRLGKINLAESFMPIPGFEPYDAETAFTIYENLPCRIVPDPDNQTTTLFTKKVGHNYAEFTLRIDDEEQFITIEGRIVRCSVLTLKGKEVAHNRRMIFVLNTPPEKKVRTLKKGDEMHVLGIPRIDLALVSWRARNAETHPEALTWNLPYEVLVVGLYGDDQTRLPVPSPFGQASAFHRGSFAGGLARP